MDKNSKLKKIKEEGPEKKEKNWWDFMTLDARAERMKRLAEEAKKKKEDKAK